MTQQFHEGQDVEIDARWPTEKPGQMPFQWRKAKIDLRFSRNLKEGFFEVKFPDGSSGIFHEDNIRAVENHV